MNDDKINMSHVKAGFSDWRIWLAVIPFWGCSIGTYGFPATVPTVIRDMGYSSAHAQLMTIPIYVAALIATVIVAFWSDHIKQRTPFLAARLLYCCCGVHWRTCHSTQSTPGSGLFFPFPHCYRLVLSVYMYRHIGRQQSRTFVQERAVGMALLISVGNLGGICGSNIYFKAEAPRYPTGFGVCLAAFVLTIIAANALRLAYQRENNGRDERIIRLGQSAVEGEYNDQELSDMGDKSPLFRYSL